MRIRIRYPGSGAFLTPGWIQDPEWVKKSGSGSGMNNPDHISDSLETIFWVKILKLFDADPGWKKFVSGIRDGKKRDLGCLSRILIFCCNYTIFKLCELVSN
jgi:hypothetical protein